MGAMHGIISGGRCSGRGAVDEARDLDNSRSSRQTLLSRRAGLVEWTRLLFDARSEEASIPQIITPNRSPTLDEHGFPAMPPLFVS